MKQLELELKSFLVNDFESLLIGAELISTLLLCLKLEDSVKLNNE